MNRKQIVLIFLGAVACFGHPARAQNAAVNKVKITADITGLEGGQWVYYGPSATFAQLKDSVRTTAGGFSLVLPMKAGEGDFYTLQIGKYPTVPGARQELYLEPGELHIQSAGPGLSEGSEQLSGSSFVGERNAFYEFMQKDPLPQGSGLAAIIGHFRTKAKEWTGLHHSSNAGVITLIQVCTSLQQQLQGTAAAGFIPEMRAACPVSAIAEIAGQLTAEAANNIPCQNLLATVGKGRFISKWEAHPWSGGSVTVRAEMKGLAAGQWLYFSSSAVQRDSLMTRAGGFTLKLPMKPGDGDIYSLQLGHDPKAQGAVKALLLMPGEVRITAGAPGFAGAAVSGNPFTAEFDAFSRTLTPDSSKTQDIGHMVPYISAKAREWSKAHPSSLSPGALMLANLFLQVQGQVYAQFKQMTLSGGGTQTKLADDKAYAESVKTVNKIIPLDSIAPLMTQVSPLALDNIPYRNIQRMAAVYANSPVAAVDFSLPDVSGKQVSLKDFRGKYVLVDFWASWCGPCRSENPNVLKAYEQFRDRGFTVLGVSLDEKMLPWLNAIKQDGLPWTQVSDLKGWKDAAAQTYSVTAIPANFLIGPDGKIIGRNLRGQDLQKKLAEVLPK